MSKRLYFTCPIKAAYMAQQFGVKFEQWLYPLFESTERELMPQSFKQICEEIQYHFNRDRKFDYDNRYIVAKESESIFEPKKGDYILLPDIESFAVVDEVKKVFDNGNIETVSYQRPFEKGKRIIMRDGKEFFMPEVENE